MLSVHLQVFGGFWRDSQGGAVNEVQCSTGCLPEKVHDLDSPYIDREVERKEAQSEHAFVSLICFALFFLSLPLATNLTKPTTQSLGYSWCGSFPGCLLCFPFPNFAGKE